MSNKTNDPFKHPVFRPEWPEGLQEGVCYQVLCDDNGRNGKAWLHVMVGPDGDVYPSMMVWPDGAEHPDPFPAIRVRTMIGGGRNMRTRQALLWLAQVMRLDAEDAEGGK